ERGEIKRLLRRMGRRTVKVLSFQAGADPPGRIVAQCRTQKGADYSLSHTAYHTGSVPLLSRGILPFSGNPPRFFSFPPASTDKRRPHRAPPVSFLRAEQRRRAKVPPAAGPLCAGL